MKLKAFIRQTLVDIAEAVAEAQTEVAKSGTLISPMVDSGTDSYTVVGGKRKIQSVEFDLSITEDDAKTDRPVLRVITSTSSESSACNRIRFSVGIAFVGKPLRSSSGKRTSVSSSAS